MSAASMLSNSILQLLVRLQCVINRAVTAVADSPPLQVMKLHAGHDPSWISFGPSGRGQQGEHNELGPNENSGQLQITVQAGRRFVANGVIAVQQLWQVSSAASHTHPAPASHAMMHTSSTASSCTC